MMQRNKTNFFELSHVCSSAIYFESEPWWHFHS